MSNLQTIIDRHAAATPGPQFVDVIDEHTGLPGSKSWLICDVARTRWGNNAVGFGEDEATARFVAASFTDVPRMAAALQHAASTLTEFEKLVEANPGARTLFNPVIADLREALTLDGTE